MTDNELTQQIQDKRKDLASHEQAILAAKANAAYLKSQIKEFEKEQKRRKKWAETNSLPSAG